MSRLICKFILSYSSPSNSIPFPAAATHIRFTHLRTTAASRDSGMASEASPSSSSSSSASPSPSPSAAIDFLTLCHRLKTTKRAGWIRRGVQEPESIGDHMYRMGLMALIASDNPSVNREKCIKMAIVHDIAEGQTIPRLVVAVDAPYRFRRKREHTYGCSREGMTTFEAIVGDITPADGVPKEEKSRREQEALQKMCELLGGGERAQEIKELWMEYEANSSMEAKVVKDFDKVEMILQALEYETEQGKDLEEFFESTAGKFQTDLGKAWALEVASRRKKN